MTVHAHTTLHPLSTPNEYQCILWQVVLIDWYVYDTGLLHIWTVADQLNHAHVFFLKFYGIYKQVWLAKQL